MSADSLQFTVTPCIQEAYELLRTQLSKAQLKQSKLASLSQIQQSKTIPLSSIKLLSRKLQENGQDIWIHQLLQGSQLYVEPPKPKPRNPELKARLDKIKQELDELEYQRMTANVAPMSKAPVAAIPGVRYGQSGASASIKKEFRDANKTISAIINILFSAVGVGFAILLGECYSLYVPP
ncbi:hypothetical protein LPJ78_000399 [Coemansia sp. RSA 989]|nr:hypothetical protein LPJ68_000203 [Coemansia sp. RSA 1086]KAJ1868099.1 hypothetical protein LPJ78_000399 [Coemansia sp. RSA 989]KAJ2676336.1 hypothetical protein IWW42_000625 [Coemansia sp. RSA 1085]